MATMLRRDRPDGTVVVQKQQQPQQQQHLQQQPPSPHVTDDDLLREVVFACQGLNGKIIRQDHTKNGRFLITPSYIQSIHPTQRMLLEKLTNTGWLVYKIKNYINYITKDQIHGRVAQSLAAALNEELLEYYSLITQIERLLQKSVTQQQQQQQQQQQHPQLTHNNHLQSNGALHSINNINDFNGPTSLGFNGGSTGSGSSVYGISRGPTQSATFDCLRTCANSIYNGNTEARPSSDDGSQSNLLLAISPPTNLMQQPIVTLHQIHVWIFDHFFRLKTLAMLVECCKGQKGGHLASIVYRFMQQGDKQIKAMITRIMGQVVLPIRKMLSQWIFHGEIQDPFGEFFIRVDRSMHNPNTKLSTRDNCLMDDLSIKQLPSDLSMYPMSASTEMKYRIEESMMPGFISRQQAAKILATGKAIHLLRRVCDEDVTSSVPGYDDLKKSFESTSIESLFKTQGILSCGEENEFQHLLNTAYKEVSQKALKLLFENYKLMSHFRGLRQYLLLGQGDFIRHLMDLLEKELDKPANECNSLSIPAVLESAIQSTNAKFDDPDVTNRLDCKLLDAQSPSDCGWDLFILVYRVDGPISNIFTADRISDYVDLFRQLWRSKRVEHVLTSLWSSQMFYSKAARALPLVSPIFHKANILLSEMMHFMQHFQDFVMFEVMECSWAELEQATADARDVDDLIAAHDTFLRKTKSGALCQSDQQSQALNRQLIELFQCTLSFKHLMTTLWRQIDGELEARVSNNANKNVNSTSEIEMDRRRKFEANTLMTFEKKLHALAARYQNGIHHFLSSLSKHHDLNLKFLRFRLDFNEIYKKRNWYAANNVSSDV